MKKTPDLGDRVISTVSVDFFPSFLKIEDGPSRPTTEDGIPYEVIKIGYPGAAEAELIRCWVDEVERRAKGKTKVILRIRPEIWRTKKMNQIYSRQAFV